MYSKSHVLEIAVIASRQQRTNIVDFKQASYTRMKMSANITSHYKYHLSDICVPVYDFRDQTTRFIDFANFNISQLFKVEKVSTKPQCFVKEHKLIN